MKKWFNSKTIWFNLLSVVATSTGWFIGVLTGHPYLVVSLVLLNAIANMVLRFSTKTSITK